MNQNKINAALLKAMEKSSTLMAEPPRFHVVVAYRGILEMQVAALEVGVTEAHTLLHNVHAGIHELTAREIDRLSEHAGVAMIELDEKKFHRQLNTSVPLIRVNPLLWNTGNQGEGVLGGIADTGVDLNNPDFEARLSLWKDWTGDGVQDGNGHGTHVHGIGGGSGKQSNGKYSGVAPKCSFLTAKVLGNDGSGYLSNVISGIDWLVSKGAKTINLSLGSDGPCDGSDIASRAVTAAWEHGVFVAVAAGNSGPSGRVGSPGCAQKVFCVGASDKQDHMASYSSIGPTADGRLAPHAVAPGSGIISCLSASAPPEGTVVDQHYQMLSGTSMATPHIWGVAVLLIKKFPNITPDEIKQAIVQTAISLGSPENVQGKGRVDAYAAYLLELGQPIPPIQPPSGGGGGCDLLKRIFG